MTGQSARFRPQGAIRSRPTATSPWEMVSAYTSYCSRCDGQIKKGDRFFWCGPDSGALCLKCGWAEEIRPVGTAQLTDEDWREERENHPYGPYRTCSAVEAFWNSCAVVRGSRYKNRKRTAQ